MSTPSEKAAPQATADEDPTGLVAATTTPAPVAEPHGPCASAETVVAMAEALVDRTRDIEALLRGAERWLDSLPRGETATQRRAVACVTRLVARAAREAEQTADFGDECAATMASHACGGVPASDG